MLPSGAFIWTNFPFGHPPEARSRPGPSPHVAYHIGSEGALSLMAYTSSGAWRGAGVGRPPGVVEFDAAAAAALNQKAFHIDLRTLAKVERTIAWFPRWDQPDRGVVAVADEGTRGRILQAARALASTSSSNVETRGIGGGATVITRRPR